MCLLVSLLLIERNKDKKCNIERQIYELLNYHSEALDTLDTLDALNTRTNYEFLLEVVK